MRWLRPAVVGQSRPYRRHSSEGWCVPEACFAQSMSGSTDRRQDTCLVCDVMLSLQTLSYWTTDPPMRASAPFPASFRGWFKALKSKDPNFPIRVFPSTSYLPTSCTVRRFFRTGDLGKLEEGLYLRVTGRIKEQFKLSNGKYVVPGPIEAALVTSSYISQVGVGQGSKGRP